MLNIIENKRLTITQRLLLIYLFKNRENNQFVIKNKKEIAEELGISRDAVIRNLKKLVEDGFILEERESVNKPSQIRILYKEKYEGVNNLIWDTKKHL